MSSKHYEGFTDHDLQVYARTGKKPLLYSSVCCVCEKEIGWRGCYITIHDNDYIVHHHSCKELLLFSPNLYKAV